MFGRHACALQRLAGDLAQHVALGEARGAEKDGVRRNRRHWAAHRRTPRQSQAGSVQRGSDHAFIAAPTVCGWHAGHAGLFQPDRRARMDHDLGRRKNPGASTV